MYKAIYKCRLCCSKFDNGETSNRQIAIQALRNISDGADYTNCHTGIAFYKRCEHYCDDGSFGIADFQGFKAVYDEHSTST